MVTVHKASQSQIASNSTTDRKSTVQPINVRNVGGGSLCGTSQLVHLAEATANKRIKKSNVQLVNRRAVQRINGREVIYVVNQQTFL